MLAQRLRRQPDVFQHRQVGEDVGDLEGAADAEMGGAVRGQIGDVSTFEQIRPPVTDRLPLSRLKNVVLPAPFGPMMEWKDPART